MDARETIVHYSKHLLDYEKTEIMDFDTIHYINTSLVQGVLGKQQHTPDGPDNGGFDNDKGEYICEAKDHISYRYEIKQKVGQGSFGQVF